jgi:hypothetical protein
MAFSPYVMLILKTNLNQFEGNNKEGLLFKVKQKVKYLVWESGLEVQGEARIISARLD